MFSFEEAHTGFKRVISIDPRREAPGVSERGVKRKADELSDIPSVGDKTDQTAML